MVSWSTPFCDISNTQQLQIFQQLPLAQRQLVIFVSAEALTENDTSTLCFPTLKGLWMSGQFGIGAKDVEVLYSAILQSSLELLSMTLSRFYFEVFKFFFSSLKLITSIFSVVDQ